MDSPTTAFNNDDKHYFVVQDNQSTVDHDNPEELGASFIYNCLHILLHGTDQRGPHKITCHNDEPTKVVVNEYLQNIAGPDNQPTILFHLDEHRKMCNQKSGNSDEDCKGAKFSKGAMQTLADMPMVTVVATYTQRPPFPPESSSSVCRSPVVKPCLNVDAAMEKVDGLKSPKLRKKLNSLEEGFDGMLSFFITSLKCFLIRPSREESELIQRVPQITPVCLDGAHQSTSDSRVLSKPMTA